MGMQPGAEARKIAIHIKVGLVTFLRGFLRIIEASRLADALAYGITAIFLLTPIGFIGEVLNWALARESIWVAFAVIVVAAGLLLLFAALMTNEQFLGDVQLQGIKWPSLLSVALAWLAVIVFGALSCGFERMGIVSIHPSVPFGDGCATKYADMYLWHLFDSIPGIKVTETVGWVQRYSYSDKFSGWLLLSFKVLVIVSVIGSFVVCGRLRREKASATNTSIQPENPKDAEPAHEHGCKNSGAALGVFAPTRCTTLLPTCVQIKPERTQLGRQTVTGLLAQRAYFSTLSGYLGSGIIRKHKERDIHWLCAQRLID